MIPLIPVLVLSFLSFASSAFVILRIIIPILPPHPLSRRVSPAEFGLPTFRSLSPADKSHIWLACLDIFALAIFIWQAVAEATGGPTGVALADDPVSAIRLWFTMTVRQGCLLMITVITLLHVRMGRSVSFGKKHWMLWAPTALLSMTSTALAGVLSGAGVSSLFVGISVYSAIIVILSTVVLGCLIGTLFIIKRNLAAMNEEADPWPPVRQVEEKPRPSFCTEEIDAIRDGASWITSTAGGSSRRNSISAWSFSTHHTFVTASQHSHPGGRPQNGSHPSVPAKSSYWFNSTTPHDIDIPPVPPLPSPYGISPPAEDLNDPDPFRRDIPSPLPNQPRGRLDSETSWLTSSNGSHTTLSAWSYPTTVHEGSIRNASTPDFQTALTAVSRPVTPAMANAQVLGGYGYAPGNTEAEKGLASLAAPPGTNLNVSVYPAIGWFLTIWVPLGLSLPYLISLSQQTTPSTAVYILFVLSVTLSSPILAVNVICDSHLPIPTGLFDVRGEPPKVSSAPSELPSNKWSHEYKRSMSTTVTAVEGRRSGDVWLTNGDAVDGKNKLGRAVGMLSPMPKLSVMPPEECGEPLTPPLPIQDADSSLPLTIHNTPETSAQFGRLRMDSKASSHHLSGGDESMAYASRIMIAQRHYSALAQTVVVPGTSPDKQQATELFVGNATGALVNKPAVPATHLRSRSITSISGPQTVSADTFNISPPPSFPLPPTPPNVRAARLAQLAHKKSFSSGFSFGPVDDMNEIDALTAGVLPLLVPGLKVGHEMKIKEDDWSPPGTLSKSKGKKAAKKLTEFGEDFSSPEIHSTPARRREPRGRKESGHKRNHFSLPSLSLGKDGIHSLATWSAEIRGALENKVGQYTSVPSNVDLGRRNTVFGAESVPSAHPLLKAVQEEEECIVNPGTGLGRVMSTRSLGLRADVPHNVNTARSSVTSNTAAVPTSAASTVTLFEDFEAGMISGPQAESTPHNTVSHKTTRRQHNAPPLPINRRSSIVYIKSENHSTITNPPMTESSSSSSAMSSFAQWSSRAVRPLMTKNSLKLQRKISTADSSSLGSPREGLRPLSLLQDRDPNTAQGISPLPIGGTRPLTLGKKQKSRMAVPQDENADPDSISSGHRKNLKSLKLARSETAKMRGILRKGEMLPDVVIRPPSTTEHTAFAYSFGD